MKHHMGEVDLFGLDEFGTPQGMQQVWGTLVGGGIATTTAIAARAVATPGSWASRYSEGLGFLVGGAASGVMIALGAGTRAAGWAGLASAFMSSGLRQLEQMLMAPPASSSAASAATNGIGYANAIEHGHPYGLGLHTANQLAYASSADVQPRPYGVAGNGLAGVMQDFGQPPVNLIGAGTSGSRQVSGMGGPTTFGLASAYGSTIFAGGR